jgi:hypothetical protein
MKVDFRKGEPGSLFRSPRGKNDGFQHDIMRERTGVSGRVVPLTDKHAHRVLTGIVATVWDPERGPQRGKQLQVNSVIETALSDTKRSDFPVSAIPLRLEALHNSPRCVRISQNLDDDVVAQGVQLQSNADCGLCRFRVSEAKGGCPIEGTPYRREK